MRWSDMRFFRTEPVTPPPTAPVEPAASKPPIIEGWSEADLVSVYNAAPVRQVKKGEPFLTDVSECTSFFVLIDGAVHVVVKLNGQPAHSGSFKRGDCMAP